MCMSLRILTMKKANERTSMSTVTVKTVLTRKNIIKATDDSSCVMRTRLRIGSHNGLKFSHPPRVKMRLSRVKTEKVLYCSYK